MLNAEWKSLDVGCGFFILHSAFLIMHFGLPGRLIVGQRPLKALVLVQIQPRQPIQMQIETIENWSLKICHLSFEQ
jgi:hypothetical protein